MNGGLGVEKILTREFLDIFYATSDADAKLFWVFHYHDSA